MNSSGTNNGALNATTQNGGNATVTNSGSNIGDIDTLAETGGNATATNSGTTTGGLVAIAEIGGNATATNSGSVAAGVAAVAGFGNATATNSGNSTGEVNDIITGGTFAISLNGNATVTNSGSSNFLVAAVSTAGGNASVINSGAANGGISIIANQGSATLTNVVAGRVVGPILLASLTGDIVNFQGGNWLQTISTQGPGTTSINTGGAPFVVVPTGTGFQIAVLDPTTVALADRSLTNFTGEISEMLQGRFGGMSTGAGGGALGFAGSPSSPVADQAQAVFSGIPSAAMSYAH